MRSSVVSSAIAAAVFRDVKARSTIHTQPHYMPPFRTTDMSHQAVRDLIGSCQWFARSGLAERVARVTRLVLPVSL
ncbi:unnamed protein product [Leuciscus chuanchicus]